MISVTGAGKEYGKGQWALRDVSFTQQKGEFVILTGASGAGKTTLMKLLSFEVAPSTGEVALEGFSSRTVKKRQLPKLRRRIGPVFQDFRLLKERTAYENVALVLRATGAPQSSIHRRVLRALTAVGLSSKVKAMPDQLSGGEQQRVAIARAIVNDPFVVLADEPTGNLDEANTREIFRLLKKVSAAGTAVLVATHDIAVASEFRARTLVLDRGRLVEEISPSMATSQAMAAMAAATRPTRPPTERTPA